jgi:muconolactone delta-isomerase
MQQYMVTALLPEELTPRMLMLIPKQREYVSILFSENKLSVYSLNAERSKLWIAINAKNEEELYEILAKFPLYEYMDVSFEPLMFHNTASNMILSYSLN